MLENLTEIQEILLLQDQIQEEERTLRKLRESLGQKKDLLYKYSLFDIALIIPTITNLINQINNSDYKYKELIFPIPRSRSSYQEYFGILYNNKARSFNKEEPQFWDDVYEGHIHIIYHKKSKERPQKIIFTSVFNLGKSSTIVLINNSINENLRAIINPFIEEILTDCLKHNITKINEKYLEEKASNYLTNQPNKPKRRIKK